MRVSRIARGGPVTNGTVPSRRLVGRRLGLRRGLRALPGATRSRRRGRRRWALVRGCRLRRRSRILRRALADGARGLRGGWSAGVAGRRVLGGRLGRRGLAWRRRRIAGGLRSRWARCGAVRRGGGALRGTARARGLVPLILETARQHQGERQRHYRPYFHVELPTTRHESSGCPDARLSGECSGSVTGSDARAPHCGALACTVSSVGK